MCVSVCGYRRCGLLQPHEGRPRRHKGPENIFSRVPKVKYCTRKRVTHHRPKQTIRAPSRIRERFAYVKSLFSGIFTSRVGSIWTSSELGGCEQEVGVWVLVFISVISLIPNIPSCTCVHMLSLAPQRDIRSITHHSIWRGVMCSVEYGAHV